MGTMSEAKSYREKLEDSKLTKEMDDGKNDDQSVR